MPISPDAKDWTWVLNEVCPECGLVAGDVLTEDIGRRVRHGLPTGQAVLALPHARVRPNTDTWSATEYACHVRDVFGLFEERLGLLITEDDPMFANRDQDVAAVDGDYASQSAERVSTQLIARGKRAAAAFDVVHHLHDVNR